MAYIKVWCEYDISGSFGGNNNEDVFEINDTYTEFEIDQALIKRFQELAEDTECETNLIEEGLMGWEYIGISTLD